MLLYPAYLSLKGKNVLVVGGGTVAGRRLSPLLEAGANVVLVAPDLSNETAQIVKQFELKHLATAYDEAQLTGQWLVIAATNNRDLNTAIAQQADSQGIFCNVANDAHAGSFICPSLINEGQCQIAIATGGAAPVLTRLLKQKVRSVLPKNLKALISFSGARRDEIKQKIATVNGRRRFWERFFNRALSGTGTDYATQYNQELSQLETQANEQAKANPPIYIALPSDLDNLTYGLVKKLHQADIVVLDPNTEQRITSLIRQDCQRIAPDAYPSVKHDQQALVIFIT